MNIVVQLGRGVVLCLLVLSLTACGGRGSSPQSGPTFSISSNTLTFTTVSPGASPAPQEIKAFVSGVSSGTLFTKVIVAGPAVSNVFIDITGPNSADAVIVPADSGALGVGMYSSTIIVTVCLNDPTCATGQLSGSPQVVNVSYEIKSPVQGDAVAPHIAISNVPGDVIIRGSGFSQATIGDVTFAGASATAFSVISGTEIHATYAALPVGSHPVRLHGISGAHPFAATLAVIDPPGYASATLSYPTPPQDVRALLYDAERRALFVAVHYASPSANQVLRYQFANGAWTSPTTVTVPKLRDIALSLDGTKLLALSDRSLTLVDPVTLTPGETTNIDFFDGGDFEFFKNVMVANDGFAIVTTGVNGSGSTSPYIYSPSNPGFFLLGSAYASTQNFIAFGTPGASDDGSLVAIASDSNPYKYVASSSILSPTFLSLRPTFSNVRPALDRKGTRIVTSGIGTSETGTFVLDGSFNVLGRITNEDINRTTLAVGIKPDGTRAYTYDFLLKGIRTFDLTQGPTAGFFPEVLTGTPLDVGGSVTMKTSPDGGTLFAAGRTAVAILPTADLEIFHPPPD